VTTEKLKAGLEILLKYQSLGEPDEVSSEHDELFLGGPEPDKLFQSERDILDRLGFRWQRDLDCWAVFT
jgi:hypothetical protein